MPREFQLISIETGKPESINLIDQKICELMGVEIHPRWYGGNQYNWFDFMCYKIASGENLHSKSYQEWFHKIFSDNPNYEGWKKIFSFLKENYTSRNGSNCI